MISTRYLKAGVLWDIFDRHFGAKGVPSILVFVCHQRRADLLRARDDRHEGAADQDAVLSDMKGTSPQVFRPTLCPSSTWCALTQSKERSAILITAAMRISSAGI
jgi:hypothetical protein